MNMRLLPTLLAFLLAVLLLAAGLLTSGCTTAYVTPDRGVSDADSLIDLDYQAAQLMLDRMTYTLDKSRPILVASFVNVDRLEESSTLGRMAAEHFGNYLMLKGYRVQELKLRKNLYVKQDGGEFLLTREAASLVSQHNAQALVVGTYGVGERNVYLSSRTLSTDGMVISAVDYKAHLTPDLLAMSRPIRR